MLAFQIFKLNERLDKDHGHVLEKELRNCSLLLESLCSLFVKHQYIFEDVHELTLDNIKSLIPNDDECVHLSYCHDRTQQFYTHDVEGSDECQEQALCKHCDDGVLLDDVWLITSIVQKQFDNR